ncbi:MAG: tripartite tricarboxylate transporter substrate binding protein [Candidatus Rokuibacteriota bacterium]
MTDRRLLAIAALLVALGSSSATGQEFPSKPINLITPFGAGGASDLTIRTFVGRAPEFLGQPIVVQLKPGGGGAIASEIVAQAKPDGYTLLFGHTNSNSILPAIEGRSKGPDDLVAVCRVNTSGTVFLAQPDAPFHSLKEMIAWAKANPGKLSVSTAGTWSAVGFTWKRMEQMMGVKLRIVSYDGGAEALVALLGGHVQASLLALPQSLPHIRAGKLRALAWSGPRRHPDLPDVPTAAEEGYDKTLSVFKGVMAPKATPRPVIEKIARAFEKLLETDQAVEGIQKLGDQIEYMGPDEFERYWRAEFETFKELGKLFKP